MPTAKAQFLPCFAKGPVVRPTAPSRPRVQKEYHKAMEQGRFVETAIGDAIFDLKKAKVDLEDKVKVCLRDIIVGSNGMFPTPLRAPLYIINIVAFAKEMKEFIDEIVGTIQALIKCIQLLIAILQNMLAMLQAMLNALAALIGEICNWQLPKLPAFPFLFGDLWNFDGFNLHGIKVGLKSLRLPTFTFPKCNLKSAGGQYQFNPDGEIKLDNGMVLKTQIVAALLVPVLPALPGLPAVMLPQSSNPTGFLVSPARAEDPEFRANFLAPKSSTPYFPELFNPSTDIKGSVPDPAKILNNYELTATEYQTNLASLVPELLPAVLANEGTGTGVELVLYKQLLHDHVTLNRVYDTRNKHITAAWLLYLAKSRTARKGKWIAEYQEVFDQYIQPSVAFLSSVTVPFNAFDPTKVVDAPEGIPFLHTLETMAPAELQILLWKLSYIEASLLSYPRTKRWDNSAVTSWHGYTAEELDFNFVSVGDHTLQLTLSSGGKAVYPVTVMIDPVWLPEIEKAVASAELDIFSNEEWRTQNPQYRYIYDQFAMASEVDRFSQFWREWKANFDNLVADETPTVLPYILNYWETINSKVNPLTDTQLYDYLKLDTLSREAGWVPGDDLIELPTPLPQGVDSGWEPDGLNGGWDGDVFDIESFINRPDIKILPVTTQLAMLDINRAYAHVLAATVATQEGIGAELSSLKALTGTSIVKGFKLQHTKSVLVKPHEKVLLKFNTTTMDITGNVTNQDLYTIQAEGEYSITGTFIFDAVTLPTIRKIEVWINQVAVFSDASDNTIEQAVLHLNHKILFAKDDIIQVKAFHNGLEVQTLVTGHTFDCLAIGAGAGGAGGITDPATGDAFTSALLAGAAATAGLITEGMPGAGVAAEAAIAAGLNATATVGGHDSGYQALGGEAAAAAAAPPPAPPPPPPQVLMSGGAVPALTAAATQATVPAETTQKAGAPPPAGAHVADTQLVAGSFNWGIIGSGLKSMPAGTDLSSLMAVYTNQDGKALPVHPETDSSDVPYFDGVTLNGGTANQTVTTALMYGQEYQITVATVMPPQLVGGRPSKLTLRETVDPFANPLTTETSDALPMGNLRPGSMMYVGPGGFVTQDFEFVKANCRWVIAVGRATATDKFIFGPHIPMDQHTGGGGSVADGGYTHTQSTPAAIWTITHGLGRYVNVEVYDADGDSVVRDVTFIDLNSVRVTLVVDTSGHAACT